MLQALSIVDGRVVLVLTLAAVLAVANAIASSPSYDDLDPVACPDCGTMFEPSGDDFDYCPCCGGRVAASSSDVSAATP